MTNNDITTLDGFLAEARVALDETLQDHIEAEMSLDDIDQFKKEMIAVLEDIFIAGEDTTSVENFDDGYGPAVDFAENIGASVFEDNMDNENIEWMTFEDVTPARSAYLSVLMEVTRGPERCLRTWFDEKYDKDILNDPWTLQ